METFCTINAVHSKYRSSHSSNGYYQTCGRAIRQGDYGLANSARTSALLWQNPPHQGSAKPRGHVCTIALAVASFFVLVAVLSIAGLAVYMGALRSENNSSLLSYSCSAKVSRGDKFLTQLPEKARKYKVDLETLYKRSILGPAVVSCFLERFGNDTVTIYFRLMLNRKKIPRIVTNIEKTIRDALLGDALSKRPVFRNVRFDPKNITVKKSPESDPVHQRNDSKEPLKTRNPVVLKPKPRPNVTVSASLPVKPKGENENKKQGGAGSAQGSFKISKTEADITEKKSLPDVYTTTHKTTSSRRTTTARNVPSTSVLHKIAVIEKTSKPTIVSSSSTTTSSTTSATTPKITSTTTTNTTTTTTSMPTTLPTITATNKAVFPLASQMFDQQPWIPIRPGIPLEENPPPPPPAIEPEKDTHPEKPVYTSFTNPGLSFRPVDSETLGSAKIKGHPIPVNKISDITEPSVWETEVGEPENKGEIQPETFVEIDTLKYVPKVKNTTTNGEQELKNISAIFHSLASSLGIIPPANVKSSEKYTIPNIKNQPNEETTKAAAEPAIIGHGQVEVIEGDEASIILQTTKAPLVTLLPAKSNSGIARPLRPRPKTKDSEDLIEIRSFPSGIIYKSTNPDAVVETEVVTSISSEVRGIKSNSTPLVPNEFRISSQLNFDRGDALSIPTPKKEREMDNDGNFRPQAEVYDCINCTYTVKESTRSINFKLQQNGNILTPEKIAQIGEINDNATKNHENTIISTKAIPSSYTINHSGFKTLTKTFNKIYNILKEENTQVISSNKTDCTNYTVKCGDGQCLPATTRCNQLVDCHDAADEKNCKCVDYLRSQFLVRKICDGVVDCWDFSDESNCDWCKIGQHVCANSKICVDKTKICDGISDCPQGDDERQCVTISPDPEISEEFTYNNEGYIMVRKHGKWGKLCTQNMENATHSDDYWNIEDLGKSVCKALTYQNLQNVTRVRETAHKQFRNVSRYYEIAISGKSNTTNLLFQETECDSSKVVKVRCNSLECGARPQAVNHIARIVGGGNSVLGAWPWQAALYKEGEFQCGATLLNDRWLLSAGHCFFHSQEEYWVARLGALRRGSTLLSPYEQLRSIIRIVIHPGYVDAGFVNDISLLQMESSVTFSDYVRPICLPPATEVLKDGTLCTVVGWGQLFEVGRIFPDTLQEVQVPLISTAECRKRTVFLPLYSVTENMFCAGFERGGRDACLGDSGGPLMCPESDGRWVLQGVTSNGYGCARANRPGVYTKVANYVGWIHQNIDKEREDQNISSKIACQGHRCPLGECLPKSRLCNGFIECSDGSDEKDCL